MISRSLQWTLNEQLTQPLRAQLKAASKAATKAAKEAKAAAEAAGEAVKPHKRSILDQPRVAVADVDEDNEDMARGAYVQSMHKNGQIINLQTDKGEQCCSAWYDIVPTREYCIAIDKALKGLKDKLEVPEWITGAGKAIGRGDGDDNDDTSEDDDGEGEDAGDDDGDGGDGDGEAGGADDGEAEPKAKKRKVDAAAHGPAAHGPVVKKARAAAADA